MFPSYRIVERITYGSYLPARLYYKLMCVCVLMCIWVQAYMGVSVHVCVWRLEDSHKHHTSVDIHLLWMQSLCRPEILQVG